MARQTTSQRGFALLEVIMILVAVGIIAFVAMRVIEATGTVDEVAKQNDSSTVATDSIPAVSASADLDKLKKLLDAVDVEGNTVSELEAETAF